MALPKLIVLIITCAILHYCNTTSTEEDDSCQRTSCTGDAIPTPQLDASWRCGCPMGPPGYPGMAGVPGSVGPPGFPGVQGPQGLFGSMGPKGDGGFEGAPGLKGVSGGKGEQGERGLDGTNGNRGLKGSKGAAGDAVKGDQGESGEQGEVGPAGLKGDKGGVGQQGLKGEIGAPYTPPPLSLFVAHRVNFFEVTSGYKNIDFDLVKLNVGDDFNPTSGIFTCRIPGVYFFSFNFFPYNSGSYLNIYLTHNGNNVAYVYQHGNTATYGTASHSTLLSLDEDDEVYLRATGTKTRSSASNGESTFNGYLIQETTE